MAVENTRDGRRFDRSYLVFGRMAELSGRSIIIGHEADCLFFIICHDFRQRCYVLFIRQKQFFAGLCTAPIASAEGLLFHYITTWPRIMLLTALRSEERRVGKECR